MKARAPGKIVLSGAYAVLHGACAVVAAVDRYVVACTERPADLVTEEVRAAIAQGDLLRAPWFDATALRTTEPGVPGGRKLGLGSSAAIVVASLGAEHLATGSSEQALADEVFSPALRAHRAAQGGGSGIDVAASCHGGILRCRLDPASGQLDVESCSVPPDLVLEVYAASCSASTSQMLDTLGRYRRAQPARYEELLRPAHDGAERLARPASAEQWIEAVGEQARAFEALGQAAQIPIVTAELQSLMPLARQLGGCLGPAGAGGGDLALYLGRTPPGERFRARARQAGLWHLPVELGAAGLGAVSA